MTMPGMDINKVNNDGFTALNAAAKGGHLEVVQEMLASSDVDVNKANINGFTALNYAAMEGHLEIVQELLSNSNVNVNNPCGSSCFTPLMHASKKGHIRIVEELLRAPTINVSVVNSNGHSALDVAMRAGNEEIAELLRSN